MEFLVLIAFAGYIYYLRNYADLRSHAEKEAARLVEGIEMLHAGKTKQAFTYFDERIRVAPKSSVAYLYRAKCFLLIGDRNAAERDLTTGLSYDDSVFELHLEMGKIRYEAGKFSEALAQLDKAVLKSGGKSAESYHWRGRTNQNLGNAEQAAIDFQNEKMNLANNLITKQTPAHKKLIDRKLIANSLLTILTSALLLWIIMHAGSIHLPYLVAVIFAMALGFAEPHKGWILALLQCIFIWLGYKLLSSSQSIGGQKELENFILYGSVILTFAGSFLGAFLKRAIQG